MTEPPDLYRTDIYIDESSQTKHRFLLLGGIILLSEEVPNFVQAIRTARGTDLPAGELKWTKVSLAKLPAYKRVVDVFFARGYSRLPHFHSIVVDTSMQDHRAFNNGNKDLGFNKEVFQLAYKFGRVYGAHRFDVYLDNRSSGTPTDDLRFMLNRKIANFGDTRDWPYRRVQFRDSKSTDILQIADLFAGAIAYRQNGHHTLDGASPAKTELSAYILKRAGISNPSIDTDRRGKFTIWHRKLRIRVPQP